MRKTPERAIDRNTLFGVVFAFSAALSYAASQVITRHSVNGITPPLIGSMLALFWGSIGFGLLTLPRLRESRSHNLRRGVLTFMGVGTFSAIGVILLFQALSRGQVVVVSPIVSTNSLWTMLFASVLLREVERISLRTIVGALLVVAGVVVLTVG